MYVFSFIFLFGYLFSCWKKYFFLSEGKIQENKKKRERDEARFFLLDEEGKIKKQN